MRNRIASLTLLVGLCLSDLATHYYDREIVLAKDRARPWQAVLYATNRNIDLLWHYLEEKDRRVLMSEWPNDWLTYRASIRMAFNTCGEKAAVLGHVQFMSHFDK